MSNILFVVCGNVRTFTSCIDNMFENVVNNLFQKPKQLHILFYLKLDDPGPKGQQGVDFTYPLVDEQEVLIKISDLKTNHVDKHIHSHILKTNEIDDKNLLGQVKDRSKYIGFLGDDKKLLRALHCHYNIEKCGQIALQIEKKLSIEFDYFVYVRPDLYFQDKLQCFDNILSDKVILFRSPFIGPSTDHFSIVPRKRFSNFFEDRMTFFRNNVTLSFHIIEQIFWHTIHPYEELECLYKIKRPHGTSCNRPTPIPASAPIIHSTYPRNKQLIRKKPIPNKNNYTVLIKHRRIPAVLSHRKKNTS